ncbi:hypothetical protein ACQKEE_12865, partial [Psychrobacter namhaensis]
RTTTLDRSGLTTGNSLLSTTVDGLGVRTGNALVNTRVSSLGVTVSNPFSTTVLSSSGLNIDGGPSVTTTGINAGNKRVINVDNGIQAKDAVNVSQLNSASAAAKTEVVAGTNVADVVKSTGDNGQDVYTVNAKGSKTSAGSAAVTVSAATDTTNLTDYAVDLSQDTKDSLIKADNSVQYDNLAKTSVTLGGMGSTSPVTLTNVAAGNISEASTDAVNGSQLFETNTKVNQGFGLKAADGQTVMKQLGEQVEVVGSNDNIDTRVRNGKIEVKLNNDLDLGSNGSISTGNIFGGTQVNRLGMVTGGLAMGGVTTVSGLGVTVTGTNPLSNATLTSDGLSMFNGPSITKSNGINAGNKKVTNVKAGVLDKDAVNVSQLNSSTAAAKTEVVAGTNVADVVKSTGDNGQDVYTVNANGTKTSAGSSAVTVSAATDTTNLTDYAVDLSQDTKDSLIKADNSVQYNNLAKTSVTLGGMGSTSPVTLTNVAAGDISEASTDAVNGSQLFETNTKVNQGFGLKAADGQTVMKQLGEQVEVVGSNDNIDTRVRNGKIEV